MKNGESRGLQRNCLLKWKNYRDFPGGPVVKNSSCNVGDLGSIPGQGTKILQTSGLTGTGTTETMHSGAHREKSAPQQKSRLP